MWISIPYPHPRIIRSRRITYAESCRGADDGAFEEGDVAAGGEGLVAEVEEGIGGELAGGVVG